MIMVSKYTALVVVMGVTCVALCVLILAIMMRMTLGMSHFCLHATPRLGLQKIDAMVLWPPMQQALTS
jgi:hypothetical protein